MQGEKIPCLNQKKRNKPYGITTQFSVYCANGGHLFACANQSNINVYKFYTGENTQEMIYKYHLGPVRCLQWLDDDSGFISGGWDGNVYTWKLIPNKKIDKENP